MSPAKKEQPWGAFLLGVLGGMIIGAPLGAWWCHREAQKKFEALARGWNPFSGLKGLADKLPFGIGKGDEE